MIKKYFSLTSLALSLILLFLTIYKSEFLWEGIRRNYYLTYYVFSIFLLIFSAYSFWINAKIKLYFSIFFLSVILSSYIFEGYFQYSFIKNIEVNEKKSIKKIAKIFNQKTGKNFDLRSKKEIFNNLKNKNTTIIVHPKNYITKDDEGLFPLSGISEIETIHCNENGYYSIYLSDRYGFNNPDKEWDTNITEYLLLGDSYVHGACVNRPNDIGSILRSLSNKSVLNLGYAGNGPLLQYATLKEYIPKNIENIIWFYYERNDMEDLKKELKSKTLLNYFNNPEFSQNLKNEQAKVNILANKLIKKELKEESQFNIISFIKLNKIRSMLTKNLPGSVNSYFLVLPEFKEILILASNIAQEKNSKLYFVYLPDYFSFMNINKDQKKYLEIKSLVDELNIPLIDIRKTFSQNSNPLSLFPFNKPGHYTIEGYNIISNEINKYVQKFN